MLYRCCHSSPSDLELGKRAFYHRRNMYDFSRRRALVTGGGRGIGKEIVKQLVGCKGQVIALDVIQKNLDTLKTELPSVQTVCVDLSDWNAARKAVEELGTIHMLVNNAGIARQGNVEEITEDDMDSLFAVNVKPIVNLSQVVVKGLKNEGVPGAIVNTSSVTSTTYTPTLAAYAASKAMVDKLTKTMAVELAKYGIRVNAVNPIAVPTDMLTPLLQNTEMVKKLKSHIPLRKFAEVGDIAAAVLFLLSDEAKMITGTCLHVDGGRSVA